MQLYGLYNSWIVRLERDPEGSWILAASRVGNCVGVWDELNRYVVDDQQPKVR